MISSKVSARYAKSLLELAKEQGVINDVHNDMKLLVDTCNSNRDLQVLLSNPIINADKKLDILTKVFSGKMNKWSLEFFKIITRKSREAYLYNIAKDFETQYKKYKGITTAIVTTACGLDDKLRKEVYDIVSKSANSEIELIEKTDKDLIGGFVLRVGDIQYDASIASDLRKLKKGLIDRSYNKN